MSPTYKFPLYSTRLNTIISEGLFIPSSFVLRVNCGQMSIFDLAHSKSIVRSINGFTQCHKKQLSTWNSPSQQQQQQQHLLCLSHSHGTHDYTQSTTRLLARTQANRKTTSVFAQKSYYLSPHVCRGTLFHFFPTAPPHPLHQGQPFRTLLFSVGCSLCPWGMSKTTTAKTSSPSSPNSVEL